jgi:hypothetical protein
MFANAVHRWIMINLRGVRQILIARFGNVNVVLNSHSTHFPVFIQHSFVNILAQCGIFQIWLDNESAEVNAWFNSDDTSRGQLSSSRVLAHAYEGQ